MTVIAITFTHQKSAKTHAAEARAVKAIIQINVDMETNIEEEVYEYRSIKM